MSLFTRRESLIGTLFGSAILAPGLKAASPGFVKDDDLNGYISFENLHGGKGVIRLKSFSFTDNSRPTNFLSYDVPVGSSEGVHTHTLDSKAIGSYDEFYYITHGVGEMNIDGKIITVKPGDHIFAPLGCAHGISNVSDKESLRFMLSYTNRAATR